MPRPLVTHVQGEGGSGTVRAGSASVAGIVAVNRLMRSTERTNLNLDGATSSRTLKELADLRAFKSNAAALQAEAVAEAVAKALAGAGEKAAAKEALKADANVEPWSEQPAPPADAMHALQKGAEREWTTAAWLSSLTDGVVGALTEALVPPAGMAPFDYAKGLTAAQVEKQLREGNVISALAAVIACGASELNEQQAATALDLNSKFAETGQAGFTLQVMGRDAFDKGIEGAIGGPTMRNGTFLDQIEFEHCMTKDSEMLFATPQTKGEAKVKPCSQWHYVIDGKEAASAAGKADEAFDIPGRNGESLDFYKAKMAEKNALLEAKGLTPMMDEEVIVTRLYSGPMYAKYNGVLRFGTGKESYTKEEVASASCPPFLQKQCEKDYKLGAWTATADGGLEWAWHNKYTTTIHSLNSAIIKLSPLSAAVPVYRGISGASLPSEFFEPDVDGVCGGVEPAFTSTTTDREVADFYAKVTKAGKASTVIEAEQGMIGRGADISWASQFSHETETLFPPRMAIEIAATRVKGHSLVLVGRLTINMTSLTLDQQAARRKTLIANMCDQTLAEIREEVRVGVHPGHQCKQSRVKPIEGIRYSNSGHLEDYCLCEAEYWKLGSYVRQGFKGIKSPLTANISAARMALAEAALCSLHSEHTAEWFNDDNNYSAVTAVPQMVGRALSRYLEAPMLRLLGCKNAVGLTSSVPPLEALQLVGSRRQMLSQWNVGDGSWYEEVLVATRLVGVSTELSDAEMFALYADPNVVSLDMREGRASIPYDVLELTALEVIDLSNCAALTSLPEQLAKLGMLKKVDLSGCKSLTALPDLSKASIGRRGLRVEGVETLRPQLLKGWEAGGRKAYDLRTSDLSVIPEIDLSGSSFSSLPEWLLQAISERRLSSLQELNLNGCSALIALPELTGLSSLRRLSLSGCSALIALPELTGLASLEFIELGGCWTLAALPELMGLSSLRRLILSDCKALTTLPSLTGSTELTLYLDGCEALAALPDLSAIEQLKVEPGQPLVVRTWAAGGYKAFSFTSGWSTADLRSIRKIDLSGSSFSSLPEWLLQAITERRLSSLQELNLNGCSALIALPELTGLSSLRRLSLSGCSALIALPELTGLASLEFIELGGCWTLAALPELTGLSSLRRLILSDCKALTTLPSLTGSTELTLYLDGCEALAALPDLSAIEQLKVEPGQPLVVRTWAVGGYKAFSFTSGWSTADLRSIRKIDLSGSSFSSLPEWLLQAITERRLSSLQELNLSGCSALTALPELTGLSSLRRLILSDCKALTTLPSLTGSTELTLYLDGCEALAALPDLSAIEQLKVEPGQPLVARTWAAGGYKAFSFTSGWSTADLRSIRKIDLSGSSFSSLPEWLLQAITERRLSSLQELNLNGCSALIALPELAGLASLEFIELGGCWTLAALPELMGLTSLKGLFLRHCKALTTLPELTGLTSLACLSLNGCHALTKLPELKSLESLEYLCVSMNMFDMCEHELGSHVDVSIDDD